MENKFVHGLNVILNSPVEQKQLFLQKLFIKYKKYNNDILLDDYPEIIRFRDDANNKIYLTIIYQLNLIASSIGYDCAFRQISVNTNCDEYIYECFFALKENKKAHKYLETINQSLCVTKLSCDSDIRYVYDIETNAGTFGIGPGYLMAKNTDSIFTIIDPKLVSKKPSKESKIKLMKKIIEWGQNCAGQITEYIANKIKKETSYILTEIKTDMKYEKVFRPLILFSKKMYIALKYEFDAKDSKVSLSGVEGKKRDFAKIIGTMTDDIIALALDSNKQLIDIKNYITKMLVDLFSGNISINQLSQTIGYRGHYARDTTPQLMLVKKIAERDPGNQPQPGDRLEFVYVNVPYEEILERRNLDGLDPLGVPTIRYKKNGEPFKKQRRVKDFAGDYMEDLSYVISEGLTLNYERYASKNIKNPICKLLRGIHPDLEIHYDKVLADILSDKIPCKPKITIVDFFGPKLIDMDKDIEYLNAEKQKQLMYVAEDDNLGYESDGIDEANKELKDFFV